MAKRAKRHPVIKVKRSAAIKLLAIVEAQAYIEDRDVSGLANLLAEAFDGKLPRYTDEELPNELYELVVPEGTCEYRIVSDRSKGFDLKAPADEIGIEL